MNILQLNYLVQVLGFLHQKIQSLAHGLKADIVTKYKKFDYIVLICHSMGGLDFKTIPTR